jgi:uncharacterized hydantoinase/oxoprolinase family protein
LARVICADRQILDAGEIEAIARALVEAQVARVASAAREVKARHPTIARAVVAGAGDFIAERAARRAGLVVIHLAQELGEAAARVAPAAALALLCARGSLGTFK